MRAILRSTARLRAAVRSRTRLSSCKCSSHFKTFMVSCVAPAVRGKSHQRIASLSTIAMTVSGIRAAKNSTAQPHFLPAMMHATRAGYLPYNSAGVGLLPLHDYAQLSDRKGGQFTSSHPSERAQASSPWALSNAAEKGTSPSRSAPLVLRRFLPLRRRTEPRVPLGEYLAGPTTQGPLARNQRNRKTALSKHVPEADKRAHR